MQDLNLLIYSRRKPVTTTLGKKVLKIATKSVQSLFKNMRGMLQISLKL